MVGVDGEEMVAVAWFHEDASFVVREVLGGRELIHCDKDVRLALD